MYLYMIVHHKNIQLYILSIFTHTPIHLYSYTHIYKQNHTLTYNHAYICSSFVPFSSVLYSLTAVGRVAAFSLFVLNWTCARLLLVFSALVCGANHGVDVVRVSSLWAAEWMPVPSCSEDMGVVMVGCSLWRWSWGPSLALSPAVQRGFYCTPPEGRCHTPDMA